MIQTPAPPPPAEQALYRGLLNGNMLSKLIYASGLAAFYAGKFTDRTYFDQHRNLALDSLFNTYRDVLEPDEEKELTELMHGTDMPRLIKWLYNLEALYMDDFAELAQESTHRIATVSKEIQARLRFQLPNPAIEVVDAVFKATREFYKDEKVEEVLQKNDTIEKELAGIRRDWGQSEMVLYNELRPKFIIHVQRNSGNQDDAHDTWAKSMSDFQNRLKATPDAQEKPIGRKHKVAYYRWFENRASVKTFFYGICLSDWLDVLRLQKLRENKKPSEKNLDPVESESAGWQPNSKHGFVAENRFEELREAIDELAPFCRRLIQLRYFEGYSLLEIVEILSDTDADGNKRFYSYRTIVKKHNECLERMKRSLYSERSQP